MLTKGRSSDTLDCWSGELYCSINIGCRRCGCQKWMIAPSEGIVQEDPDGLTWPYKNLRLSAFMDLHGCLRRGRLEYPWSLPVQSLSLAPFLRELTAFSPGFQRQFFGSCQRNGVRLIIRRRLLEIIMLPSLAHLAPNSSSANWFHAFLPSTSAGYRTRVPCWMHPHFTSSQCPSAVVR